MRYYSFKKTYLLVIGIFFSIIFLHYLGILNFVENKIRDTVVLILKPITVKFQNNIQSDICSNTITIPIDDQSLIKNKILEQENFELKNQLNFKNHSSS